MKGGGGRANGAAVVRENSERLFGKPSAVHLENSITPLQRELMRPQNRLNCPV